MPYNTIHLQVDNRSDERTHPQNTPDNFYVNLKTPIYLNRGTKIALTDVSYPNYIQKLPNSIYEEEHDVEWEMDRINIDLDFSTDLDAKQLINQMNAQRTIYKDTILFDLLKKIPTFIIFKQNILVRMRVQTDCAFLIFLMY